MNDATHPTPASPQRPKVALVIGSGALKCVAAFGALDVLLREGIPIDMVVGCSGGAFGALWLARGGGDIDEAIQQFAVGWQGTFDRVDYRKVLSAVFPKLFRFNPRFGIMRDEAANRSLRAYVGDLRFESLKTPMHLVATDFDTGEKVVFSSGAVFDAVRASISIPLVFAPWAVDGRFLVDGAVCDPLPIDVAIKEGADIIIAIGFEEPLKTDIQSGLGLILQLKSVLVNQLYRSQFAFYNVVHHAEIIPIIPNFGTPVGLHDLHRIPDLVAQGARATEAELPYLKKLLGG